MAWAKKYPRLYAIVGVLLMAIAGLATIEGIWALFNADPLVPFLYEKAQAVLPEWPRLAVIGFWLLLTLLGGILLVIIFRRTRKVTRAEGLGGDLTEQVSEGTRNSAAIRLMADGIVEQVENA